MKKLIMSLILVSCLGTLTACGEDNSTSIIKDSGSSISESSELVTTSGSTKTSSSAPEETIRTEVIQKVAKLESADALYKASMKNYDNYVAKCGGEDNLTAAQIPQAVSYLEEAKKWATEAKSIVESLGEMTLNSKENAYYNAVLIKIQEEN